jgi:hypothetical protein
VPEHAHTPPATTTSGASPATAPAVELTYPTTLWQVACPGFDADELLSAMAGRLPPGGLTADHLRRRFPLKESTLRLLDSRVLHAAIGCFHQDVAGPLASGLGAYQRVVDAARETLGDSGQQEVTVVLLDPYPVTWADPFEVAVSVDHEEIAAFPFRLQVGVNLGETSLVVRGGAIETVSCALASLAASFTFAGLTPPLWAPEPRPLSVRLALRPPLRVPIPATASPAEVAGPTRAAQLPPVPAPRER